MIGNRLICGQKGFGFWMASCYGTVFGCWGSWVRGGVLKIVEPLAPSRIAWQATQICMIKGAEALRP